MLLFRSEGHVDRWATQWQRRGAVFSLRQAWDLARAWYGEHRGAPGWRRPSLDETERLLQHLGLDGPFWALRPAGAR